MRQEEQTALRSAIRRMPNPVFVFDTSGLLLPMNQPAADLAAGEQLHERIFVERPAHPISKLLRETLASENDPGAIVVTLPSGRKIELTLSRTSEKRGARWILLFFRDPHQSRVPTADMLVSEWGMTPREADVARQLLEGRDSSEICAVLNIAPDTLKTHLTRIFSKTSVRTRTELVAKLIR